MTLLSPEKRIGSAMTVKSRRESERDSASCLGNTAIPQCVRFDRTDQFDRLL